MKGRHLVCMDTDLVFQAWPHGIKIVYLWYNPRFSTSRVYDQISNTYLWPAYV